MIKLPVRNGSVSIQFVKKLFSLSGHYERRFYLTVENKEGRLADVSLSREHTEELVKILQEALRDNK